MVVIVWGSRMRFAARRTVAFACPPCGCDRPGQLGVVRRWFTLFWVPLVPLGRAQRLVRCCTCRTRFEASILDRPTNGAMLAALPDTIRRLAVAILRGGESLGHDVQEAAVDLVAGSLPGYDAERLDHDLLHADLGLLDDLIVPLRAGMSIEGNEHLIARLTRLAVRTGAVSTTQRYTLHAVGRVLGLTPLHVDGVLAVSGAGQPADRDDRPPAG